MYSIKRFSVLYEQREYGRNQKQKRKAARAAKNAEMHKNRSLNLANEAMDKLNKGNIAEAERLNQKATRLANTAKSEASNAAREVQKVTAPRATSLWKSHGSGEFDIKAIKKYQAEGNKPVRFKVYKNIDTERKGAKVSPDVISRVYGPNKKVTSRSEFLDGVDSDVTSRTNKGYSPRYVDSRIEDKKIKREEMKRVRSVKRRFKTTPVNENVSKVVEEAAPTSTPKSSVIPKSNPVNNNTAKKSGNIIGKVWNSGKLGKAGVIGAGVLTAGGLAYGGKKLMDRKKEKEDNN